jgi:hypothetical protein
MIDYGPGGADTGIPGRGRQIRVFIHTEETSFMRTHFR